MKWFKDLMPKRTHNDFCIGNRHEATISKEIFMQVQEELIRRSAGHVGTSGKKRNFSYSHPFSQIVFCGECGEI